MFCICLAVGPIRRGTSSAQAVCKKLPPIHLLMKDRGAASLERKIYRCVQAQAAHKGIEYTKALAYYLPLFQGIKESCCLIMRLMVYSMTGTSS